MIKAIIFDLDNCIFDTSSMGGGAISTVLDALHASDLSEEIKIGVSLGLKTDPLEDVLQRLNVPESIGEQMRHAYREVDLSPDRPAKSYGDEQVIKELPVMKILVTSGYTKFQHAKIKRLNISDLFDEIIVDILDYPAERKGKKKIFQEILDTHKLQKDEVLAVGDNPRSELGAAKDLGIKTVQTLRPGVKRWEEADAHIISLDELKNLI